MTPERFQRLASILRRRQLDLTVLMEHVHKPHNLSAIMRSCDAAGVQNLHAVTKQEHIKATKSAASGSGKWLSLHQHSDISTAIENLHAAGMQVLAAHPSASEDFREMDYTRPTAILLGTELYGVSEQALALSDQHILIPMLGTVDSLNVSVAAALILFEAQRQRLQAGLYEQQQLDEQEFNTLLFEWSHPRIARFYKERELDYPALNDQGELCEQDVHRLARLQGQGCSRKPS